MKITKKELSKVISSYLNESPDAKDVENTAQMDQSAVTLSPSTLTKSVRGLWDEAQKNPSGFTFPVYAFLRYCAGDGSDFTEKELSKLYNGQKYIDELTKILDIAALPHHTAGSDGKSSVYLEGHKQNGFAMNYNDKDVAFYVVDYEVLLGQGGKKNINAAWLDAFTNKGKLSDHLGVTIGQSGTGGKQIAQKGITEEIMLRPDLQNGQHRLVNEFDFTRLAPSQVKEMTFGEVFSFYLSDFTSHLKKGPKATLTYLAGRTLNQIISLVQGDVAPFKYDIILKSKITNWPDMKDYPFPKSAISSIDSNEKVNTIKGQQSIPWENKRPESDPYDDVSPGAFF